MPSMLHNCSNGNPSNVGPIFHVTLSGGAACGSLRPVPSLLRCASHRMWRRSHWWIDVARATCGADFRSEESEVAPQCTPMYGRLGDLANPGRRNTQRSRVEHSTRRQTERPSTLRRCLAHVRAGDVKKTRRGQLVPAPASTVVNMHPQPAAVFFRLLTRAPVATRHLLSSMSAKCPSRLGWRCCRMASAAVCERSAERNKRRRTLEVLSSAPRTLKVYLTLYDG